MQVMRPLGKIIFCRMVMDKPTGKHKVIAFLESMLLFFFITLKPRVE